MERFERVRSDHPDVQRLSDSARSSFDLLTSKQIVDGQLLTDISLAAGITNNIGHGLGRNILGFIVVNRSANSVVWRSGTATSTLLPLSCSATVTVSLWVF